MSFQAYLDTIEDKTGLTPRQLVDLAAQKGFGPSTKAGEIVAWLAADYGLGHGFGDIGVITRLFRVCAKIHNLETLGAQMLNHGLLGLEAAVISSHGNSHAVASSPHPLG